MQQEDVFQVGDTIISLSQVMCFENAANTVRASDSQRSLMVHTFDGADMQRFIKAMDRHLGLVDA